MKLPPGYVPMLPPDIVAPEKQMLRYITQPRLYAIAPELKPTEGEFEGLYFRECHVSKPEKTLPDHIGDYTLTIEAELEKSGEVMEASLQIEAMTRDLDKFWVYGCGQPLFPVGTHFIIDATPIGWQTNMHTIKEYFLANGKTGYAVVCVRNREWVVLPYYPLLPVLRVRGKYQNADPLIKALADLHYAALKLTVGEGRLFSFAKALELAREILPGTSDSSRENSLNLQKGSLKRSFHWLFDVANNRYNTRHVIQRASTAPALNPKMTGQEVMDYEHDADLILRTLVCQKLEIPTPDTRPLSPPAPAAPVNPTPPAKPGSS